MPVVPLVRKVCVIFFSGKLIASGELPDCVIEEWSEKTERELRIMGIKVTKV